MVEFEPVALPTYRPGTPPAELEVDIGRWVRSPPVRALVAEFGGCWPDLATGALLGWLDEFSAVHWDFRNRSGGVERDEVAADGFSPERIEIVKAAATALGLAEPSPPPSRTYTQLLVLGGLARACLVRTAFTAHLLGKGMVAVGEVAALGSFRPLRRPETDLLQQLGRAGCAYEVDAMDIGVRSAFGFTGPSERHRSEGAITHRSWSVATYCRPDGPPVHVLAAPSSEPAVRRATTPDTYHFWARRVKLSPHDRVLVVTTPLYVPFQHCDAIRALGLPYGCAVESIGFDPALIVDPLLSQVFTPDRYLQEIRSAVRSMRDLFGSLAESAAG